MSTPLANASAARASEDRMSIAHLFGFLIGRRESIVAAARDRSTIWIGLVLVFVAALAREYDGEDLLREPWHLLISLGASLVLSLPLWAFVRRTEGVNRQPFAASYRRFLGLFWLTAPMALLYAIPYERMLPAADSVRANLWTLALVATWRVLLISQVVSVITGRSFAASLAMVAFVANVFAFAALVVVPLPTLSIMGGVRLSEADSLLASTAFLTQAMSFLLMLPLMIGALLSRRSRNVRSPIASDSSNQSRLACGPLIAACSMLVAFGFVMPFTQREQRLRSDVERLLKSGDVRAGLIEMSRHSRDEFPPAWDPPPRVGWPGSREPSLAALASQLDSPEIAQWVRDVYRDKLASMPRGVP